LLENLLAEDFFAFFCDLEIFLAYEVNIFVFSYYSWLTVFSQSASVVSVCGSRIIKVLAVIIIADDFRVVIDVILFVIFHLAEFSELNKRIIREDEGFLIVN